MEIEQLEKQFQIWNRFMWMILGSSITLAIISSGTIFYGQEWPGFDNYVGGVWTWIQLLATPPGFYLLWAKQWRDLPLSKEVKYNFWIFCCQLD